MDWNECINKRIAKKKQIDEELIKSLIQQSNKKYKAYEKLKIEEDLVEVQFILVYDYLREILEALALKKGYKIENHEAYTPFLKEICNKEEESAKFDRLRFLRNGVQYYAKTLFIEEGKKLIKEALDLAKHIKEEYFYEK